MEIVPLKPLDIVLSYQSDVPLVRGQIVSIPFRSRIITGVVWSTEALSYKGSVKCVDGSYPFVLPEETLTFIEWVATYTMIPLGQALKFCLPRGVFEKEISLLPPLYQTCLSELSVEQRAVCEEIKEIKPYLIDGVTGSGKTEIYFHKLEEIVREGKQGLVLLPEIALTQQWMERFEKTFGVPPLIWHSGVTPSQRRKTWQTVLSNSPCIVFGARSALFLPFSNLGLIVIDEEHDSSFKQNEPPFYHARDMAVVRAHLKKIPILLGSATPSLETYRAALSHRYAHLILKKRFGDSVLPTIHIVNMQGSKDWISKEVKQAIAQGLLEKNQTLVYMNRRGYAPICLCMQCGHKVECQKCQHPMTFHKLRRFLLCHHCGLSAEVLEHCPRCHKEDPWKFLGPGVERISEVLQRLFPTARLLTLSSDEVFDAEKIINHEVDILVGTQILAKGHHFPLLRRVVVVDADMGMMGYDFRGLERTFQILQQVSGRAGREETKGHVWIQTVSPHHPMIQCLLKADRDHFYTTELLQRESMNSPPFSRAIAVILSSFCAQTVERVAKAMAYTFPKQEDVVLLGPSPAPFFKLRNKYRWRFLIQGKKPLQKSVHLWLKSCRIPRTIDVRVDVDPYDFY